MSSKLIFIKLVIFFNFSTNFTAILARLETC